MNTQTDFDHDETQTVMSFQVGNSEADVVDTEGAAMFHGVQWECESGDFWTTFDVWSVFDTDESRAEVQRFVDWATDVEEA